jgi:hypothetical protein
MFFVLKINNVGTPINGGVATRIWFVGPFPDHTSASFWGLEPDNNPKDAPFWQVVEPSSETLSRGANAMMIELVEP